MMLSEFSSNRFWINAITVCHARGCSGIGRYSEKQTIHVDILHGLLGFLVFFLWLVLGLEFFLSVFGFVFY